VVIIYYNMVFKIIEFHINMQYKSIIKLNDAGTFYLHNVNFIAVKKKR